MVNCVNRTVAVLAVVSALTLSARAAQPPTTCPTTIDPNKSFFTNFNNACYAIPLGTSTGTPESGDPNATYDQIYYQVTPGYELVLFGIFPNARFLSATIYDDHLAVTSSMTDAAILPLTSKMINPLLPGKTFVAAQRYGITVSFGGQPTNVAAGCSTSGTRSDQNLLDASQLHQGLSWTGYPGLPVGFPAHETGPNAAGIVMIRKYLDIDSPTTPETIIVRSLSNGCAITAQQASQLGILSKGQTLSSPWLHQSQITAHQQFAQTIQPSSCFPADPLNQSAWLRATDYIPLNDNYAGYMNAAFTTSQIQSLLSGQSYLRIRFQAPTTPTTPCAAGSCSLTGNEQTRYRSISFQSPAENVAGPATLFSIADPQFVKDPNGNVTVIVGFGPPPPSVVTAANYYTWLDMSQVTNFSKVIGMRVRDIVPNISFNCSTFNVPYRTTEINPLGGYMGNYVPTVDFPTAAELPAIPLPIIRLNTCNLVPIQIPNVCPYTNAARVAP